MWVRSWLCLLEKGSKGWGHYSAALAISKTFICSCLLISLMCSSYHRNPVGLLSLFSLWGIHVSQIHQWRQAQRPLLVTQGNLGLSRGKGASSSDNLPSDKCPNCSSECLLQSQASFKPQPLQKGIVIFCTGGMIDALWSWVSSWGWAKRGCLMSQRGARKGAPRAGIPRHWLLHCVFWFLTTGIGVSRCSDL